MVRASLLFAALALAACGGRIAPLDGPREAGVREAEAPPDTDIDASAPDTGHFPVDAATPGFTLEIGSIDQDCYPHPAPDPLVVAATLTITNATNHLMGPLPNFARASLIDANDAVVSTFFVEFGYSDPIARGATKAIFVGKIEDTLSPRDHCGNRCGQPFRVAIDLAGPGFPPQLVVVSAPFVVACT